MEHSDEIYGHNGVLYRQEIGWGSLNPQQFPVNDCHEIVQDKEGRIYVLTNDTSNNILVYNRGGTLDYLYSAVLRSSDMNHINSGFVTILNKENQVVSNIGGTRPVYRGGVLMPMHQDDALFKHPHDVCVDQDDNLYVIKWSSGKVYPYKFMRV